MKNNAKVEKFAVNLLETKITGKGTQKSAFLNAGYKAKNNQIARSNASRLANHPLVQKKITNFITELQQKIPQQTIVDRMKNLVEKSQDPRVVLDVIEKWLRLTDQYPAGKIRIGAIQEISDIYTEVDVQKRREKK